MALELHVHSDQVVFKYSYSLDDPEPLNWKWFWNRMGRAIEATAHKRAIQLLGGKA